MKSLKLLSIGIVITSSFLTLNLQKADAEWKSSSDNKWWYEKNNSYAIGWEFIHNNWYYFDSDGYMKTGWIYDSNKWYYMNLDGSMKTGWIIDNGNKYFANHSGEMQTGIIKIGDKTYYLLANGAMQTGNININGENYYFAETGEAQGDKIPKETKAFTIDGVIINSAKTNNTNTSGKKSIEITLKTSPATGYDWQYTIDKAGIIKEVSMVYKKDEVPEGIISSAGNDIWTFEGIKEGSALVTFKYLRSWENKSIETKTFKFIVDKDLNVTVSEIPAPM